MCHLDLVIFLDSVLMIVYLYFNKKPDAKLGINQLTPTHNIMWLRILYILLGDIGNYFIRKFHSELVRRLTLSSHSRKVVDGYFPFRLSNIIIGLPLLGLFCMLYYILLQIILVFKVLTEHIPMRCIFLCYDLWPV